MTDKTVSEMTAATTKPLWQKMLPLVVVAGLALAFFLSPARQFVSFEQLETHQETLQGWVSDAFWPAILGFALLYATGSAIPFFPGSSALTIAGGFLFGLWAGTAAVVIGATAGSTLLFLAAKGIFGDMLREKAGGFIARMEQGFREDELSYMFVLRLVPLFPFFAVNIAAGVLGVKLRNYLIGTFFGIIPGTFVFVSIGNAIGATFEAESFSIGSVLTKPAVLLPIAGLILLALIPVVYKRFFRKNAVAGV